MEFMNFVSIILFFVYTWGFGSAATAFLKLKGTVLERFFTRVGIGFGVWISLGIILNALNIPLHWLVFLVLSIAYPVYSLIRKGRAKRKSLMKGGKVTFSKDMLAEGIVLLLALIIFAVYLHASWDPGFMPSAYFADSDPMPHAGNTVYVAMTHTIDRPVGPDYKGSITNTFSPYPQGFGIVYGVLHQTSPSVFWTLKFFNMLIIGLTIVFFYYFALRFVGSRGKALLATFLLWAIPSYLSRFIWPTAMNMALFSVAFYCSIMLKDSKWWFVPGGLVVGAIMVTQGTTNVIFGMFFALWWVVDLVQNRKFNLWLTALAVLGILIAVVFYLPYTFNGDMAVGGTFEGISRSSGLYGGFYTVADHIVARTAGKIDNTEGWGVFISLLLATGLVFFFIRPKKNIKSLWVVTAFLWFVLSMLGTNSMRLPYHFYGHRFWVALAIPVVLIAAEGGVELTKLLKKLKVPALLVMIIIVAGVMMTSAYPKYKVNTSPWPIGVYANPTELASYLWLKNLPENTMVMPLCSQEYKVIALDKLSVGWLPEIVDYHENWGWNATPDESYDFLKRFGYEYIIIDSQCAIDKGVNETNEKIMAYGQNPRYRLVYPAKEGDPNGALIFRLV